MKCEVEESCGFETTAGQKWQDAQAEYLKHCKSEHPDEWRAFMDWLLG